MDYRGKRTWIIVHYCDLLQNSRKVIKEGAKKITVLWDVRPWYLVDVYRRFSGTYCFALQDNSSTLKVEDICSSETSADIYQSTKWRIPEGRKFHKDRSKNIRSEENLPVLLYMRLFCLDNTRPHNRNMFVNTLSEVGCAFLLFSWQFWCDTSATSMPGRVAANVALKVFVLYSDWAKLIFNIRLMFTSKHKRYICLSP